jgi:hypothetical protein
MPAMKMARIKGFDINDNINAMLSYETTVVGHCAAISQHIKLAKLKKAINLPKKSLTMALAVGANGGEKRKKMVSKWL